MAGIDFRVRIGLLVVLACAAFAVTFSAAEAGGRSVLVVRLKSVQTAAVVVHDQPPSGQLGKGDVIEERDKLFNVVTQLGRPTGALVGTDEATFTLTSGTTVKLVETTRLPGGSLTVRGTASLTSKTATKFEIVGGTGRYLHATGFETEPSTDRSPRDAHNNYRITLP